jgi:16S rRNA processing protein RimM
MIKAEDIFKIGTLTRVHGVSGELNFHFTDDVFDRADADYLFLQLDGLPVPFYIEEYRFKGSDDALMKFENIDTADAAERICGADVYFPVALVPEEAELPQRWSSLTGFEVSDVAAGSVGRVVSVDDSSQNILLRVKKDGKEFLLPFHEDLLVAYDEKKRTLLLHLPEGLLTIND